MRFPWGRGVVRPRRPAEVRVVQAALRVVGEQLAREARERVPITGRVCGCLVCLADRPGRVDNRGRTVVDGVVVEPERRAGLARRAGTDGLSCGS